MAVARGFRTTLLPFMLGAGLLGLPGETGAGEHHARALGIVTAERGRKAPDFSLRDATGTVRRLGDYRGKIVLLGFGATW
jgi:hypothetical protein